MYIYIYFNAHWGCSRHVSRENDGLQQDCVHILLIARLHGSLSGSENPSLHTREKGKHPRCLFHDESKWFNQLSWHTYPFCSYSYDFICPWPDHSTPDDSGKGLHLSSLAEFFQETSSFLLSDSFQFCYTRCRSGNETCSAVPSCPWWFLVVGIQEASSTQENAEKNVLMNEVFPGVLLWNPWQTLWQTMDNHHIFNGYINYKWPCLNITMDNHHF